MTRTVRGAAAGPRMASINAAALARVSAVSARGSEFRTRVAPTPTAARPDASMSAVRMISAESRTRCPPRRPISASTPP
jgi:hypothetical protein